MTVADQLVETWLEFATALRMKKGFNDEQYQHLQSALKELATEWADLDHLPRDVVNVLVDVFPVMESNAGVYTGELKEKIMDAAFSLHDLVQECVALK
ncbi:hypothetical protein FQN54_008486 [Arachnomyces sp. PD_36]|nr:hypothetical protein FQN54_008486 [Arachnomyces sp. PD_36]